MSESVFFCLTVLISLAVAVCLVYLIENWLKNRKKPFMLSILKKRIAERR